MVQIIDAKNLILGRLASYAAKQAIMGEKVIVVNCEDAVVSGAKKMVENHYVTKRQQGSMRTGPFFPRRADMIVRRTIRGMLPRKIERGRRAFARVSCYLGIPKEYADQKIITIDNASVEKLKSTYITIAQISNRIGRK